MKTKKTKSNKGAEALRAYLDSTGMSVREMARRAEVSYQTAFYHLQGKNRIGGIAARRYHKHLGISLEKLIGE